MKKLITLTALLLSVAGFAHDSIIHDLDRLPGIDSVKVNVHYGPRFAAVQPTAEVEFNYASCATMRFDVDTERSENVLFVKVLLKSQIDCMGPTIKRNYKLQVTSDFHQDRNIVVLNPIMPALGMFPHLGSTR